VFVVGVEGFLAFEVLAVGFGGGRPSCSDGMDWYDRRIVWGILRLASQGNEVGSRDDKGEMAVGAISTFGVDAAGISVELVR
jgi:hypothetical protein